MLCMFFLDFYIIGNSLIYLIYIMNTELQKDAATLYF